ncbi:MAG TPA: YXWGXW repeat-containing protein [Gemmataceae bacterium]|nr:YXWGXW repeat-containing protein [Gemmataceae bacterium]
MPFRSSKPGGILLLLAGMLWLSLSVHSQEAQQSGEQQTAAPAAASELPPVPQGVEVLARGPVHEAFATPTTEPVPTKPVAKEPPKPLEEMPPAEKPEGNVTWIAGYWAWDDDKNDYLWVSGTWRVAPPNKKWVAGYWKEDGNQWRWVPGFWTAAEAEQQATAQQITYLPAPPAPPETAGPGQAPTADSFYVPGHWVFHNAGYVTIGGAAVWREAGYAWEAGYWARVQPGYVWVAAHYRWTPSGFVYIPGYWDLVIANRGVLYAPVYVDTVVVGPRFVYTPAYCVRDTIVLDAMFVRPCYCHYYFGDYYEPRYHELGFETCIVYSRRHYDAVFVYERYQHRADPRWESVQIDISLGRSAGRYPVPPRTLVQQNVIVQNNVTINNINNVKNVNVVNNNTTVNRTVNNSQVLMPTSQLAASKGIRTVPLDTGARQQAQQQAQAIRQVAMQRSQTEVPVRPGQAIQPRTASLNVPHTQPVITRQEAARGVQNSNGMVRTAAAQQTVSPAGGGKMPGNTNGVSPAANSARPAALTGPSGAAGNSANQHGALPGMARPAPTGRPSLLQQRPAQKAKAGQKRPSDKDK